MKIKLTLTTDIINTKRRLLAKKGDKVTLIAEHGEVLIVEGKERFSVKKELTDYEYNLQSGLHKGNGRFTR